MTHLDYRPDGVRAAVSVVLTTYPGKDIRAMIRGAATVSNALGRRATQRAIEGAILSALKEVPDAMARNDLSRYQARR